MILDFNLYVKDGNFLDLSYQRAIVTGHLHELVTFMQSNSIITSLNLLYNCIGAEGAKAIAEILKFNTTLTSLNLLYNCIGAEGAKVIAEVLKLNATLATIELSYNYIDVEGVKAIAKALKLNTTLATIELSYNYIDVEGVKAIAKALKLNTTLTSLNLQSSNIGTEGAKAIAEALKINTTLTNLNLQSSNIDNEGAKAIAEALKINTTLTNLNLSSYNHIYIGAEGAKAIAKALEINTTLTNLNLENTNIDAAVKANIDIKLQRNKEIKDISESFKLITYKMILGTDGIPLLSLDTEDSKQNSLLNILKKYSEKYEVLSVLEQIISRSMYKNTMHVYQNETKEIELLSFTTRLNALTKVTQVVLKHLEFSDEIINEFNSKIIDIVDEVKEMFLLELEILNGDLVVQSQINKFDLEQPFHFLYYYETANEFQNDQQSKQFNDSTTGTEQLTKLYKQYPNLKLTGTILQSILKTNTSIYDDIAVQLRHHKVKQTFKHNPEIQNLLNDFYIELPTTEIQVVSVPLQEEKPQIDLTLNVVNHSNSDDVSSLLGETSSL